MTDALALKLRPLRDGLVSETSRRRNVSDEMVNEREGDAWGFYLVQKKIVESRFEIRC